MPLLEALVSEGAPVDEFQGAVETFEVYIRYVCMSFTIYIIEICGNSSN